MNIFFKPTNKTIIMFTLFMLIAIVGNIQAEYFHIGSSIDSSGGLEQCLRKIPVWEIWVILIAPAEIFITFLCILGIKINLNTEIGLLFWTYQAIYFYLLACLINYVTGYIINIYKK